jgi:CelD/BcsL family acetyltransferase involved in cellulose biosynthesis
MASTSVHIVDTLDPLESEWAQLAERVQAAPFLYPAWFGAWRSAFGRGTLRLLVARREGRLVGVLPMEIRHGAWRSPTNAHTPGFDILAADQEAAAALASAVLADRPSQIAVRPLDAEGRGLRALAEAARSRGYRKIVQPTGRSPYLRLAGVLDQHERALSRNLRHDVQRRMRRLCEEGIVSVQVSDGAGGLPELLAEGFGVEARSWKGRRGTAVAARDDATRFYTQLARSAAAAGWLRLAFLRLGGHAIAFQFDLEVSSRYYSLKIGYDPVFERFSPGKLLTYMMAARAVVRGLQTYELLGTDEPWKERWTVLSRDQVSFRAFSPSPLGRIAAWTYVHGRPIAQARRKS